MFNILLGRFIFFTFLIIIVCEIKTSEVPRPRGVPLSRVALYPPDKDFTCFDNSLTIPFVQVNDNYCDCPDGSDEPGTSACPNGLFYCTNAGHKPLILPASRINDGICDCCDASDEYATSNSNCVNNCNELGRTARAEAQKRAELIKLGSQMRSELSQKGILLKQEKKEKLLVLSRNKNEAEHVRNEKEALKKEAEDMESIALQAYKKVEDEHQEEVTQQEDESNRNEALEAFNRFDSNQDGKLEISELQTRPTFDRDRNGEITEEEARFFLDENSDVDFEDFFAIAWPKIKPFLMMEAGLFKPPGEDQEEQPQVEDEERTEADDMQDDDEHEEENDDGFGDDADDHEPEEDKEEAVVQSPPALQYDEETQKLINQANDARQEFNNADQAWRNIQTEIKEIEDSLQKDYGQDEEFSTLDGQCFEYTDREYIYKLCPFDQVSQQPNAGGSDTRLGQWGSWAGAEGNKYDVMLYDRGQSCWNGPQRSAHVRVHCGGENALVSVAEPNRCEYLMDFTTPAACNPALVEKSNEDTHDEL